MVNDASDTRSTASGPVRPDDDNVVFDKIQFPDKDTNPVDSSVPEGAEHDGDAHEVGGEDAEGAAEEFDRRAKPAPYSPSAADKDHHETTGHAIFRNWCDSCIQGRGRDAPHSCDDHTEDETPVLSWDYGFLRDASEDLEPMNEQDQNSHSPVLVLRDRKSQSCFWYLVPRKGTDFPTFDVLLAQIVEDLDTMGYRRVVFRSDGEPAILAVLDYIKQKWKGEVIPEKTPEGDHPSNGNAEGGMNIMKNHVRTVKFLLNDILELPFLTTTTCLLGLYTMHR